MMHQGQKKQVLGAEATVETLIAGYWHIDLNGQFDAEAESHQIPTIPAI